MAPWSRISWPQWIGRSREPSRPDSVIGVRPEVNRIGTSSRAALSRPMSAFAMPTLTWTMTACGRPEAR